MSTAPRLSYPNHSTSSSNYNDDGSSYNYTRAPSTGTATNGQIGATVQQLNQSNPNFSAPQNFSTKFSPDSSSSLSYQPESYSSRGLMTLNNANLSHNAASSNLNSNPGPGVSSRPPATPLGAGIGVYRPSLKPKEEMTKTNSSSAGSWNTTFSPGTKSNNQHDTDSKWTNAYVYNTGTSPEILSTRAMESLKSKWGPTRDELKDQLANSLASDTNISILPGYKSNTYPTEGSRRHFRPNESASSAYRYNMAEVDEGPVERVPSPVTRAQNAIGRTRFEIGQAQTMIDTNMAKAESMYRNPRGDRWTSMGTPGLGCDTYNVKRYKQDSYRKDLQQQMEQQQIRKATERRLHLEGAEHPFGPKYNSPVPTHYDQPKIPIRTSDPYIPKPDNFSKPSPRSQRLQSQADTDDIIGRSSAPSSQRRHFPEQQHGAVYKSPVNHEQRPRSPPSLPARQEEPRSQQPFSAREPEPYQHQPGYPNPYFPYGPPQPQAYPQYTSQPPPPQQQQGYGGFPQYQMQPPQLHQRPPSASSYPPFPPQHRQQPPPMQHDGWNQVYKPQNSPRYERPQSARSGGFSDERPIIGAGQRSLWETNRRENSAENFNNDDDDCSIPMKMRIWQTSDQLPDPEVKISSLKADLKKQIMQKRREKAEQEAKAKEEDAKHDRRILEYQAQMQRELEMERAELANRTVTKQRARDLAFQRTAESHRLKEQNKLKGAQNNHSDDEENLTGGGDLREQSSSTSVSSSSDYETVISSPPAETESYPGSQPEILLPTIANHIGPVNPEVQQLETKRAADIRNLFKIQRILSAETRRVEKECFDENSFGDHGQKNWDFRSPRGRQVLKQRSCEVQTKWSDSSVPN